MIVKFTEVNKWAKKVNKLKDKKGFINSFRYNRSYYKLVTQYQLIPVNMIKLDYLTSGDVLNLIKFMDNKFTNIKNLGRIFVYGNTLICEMTDSRCMYSITEDNEIEFNLFRNDSGSHYIKYENQRIEKDKFQDIDDNSDQKELLGMIGYSTLLLIITAYIDDIINNHKIIEHINFTKE